MTDADLSLVPSTELVAELKRRADTGIVMIGKSLDESREERICEWWGGWSALGILSYIRVRIMRQCVRLAEDDMEPDDE